MKRNGQSTGYFPVTPLGNLKWIMAKRTLQTYYFENQKTQSLAIAFLGEKVLLDDIIWN